MTSRPLIAPGLKPDWEKTRMVLSDPAIWPSYTRGRFDLRPVYADLRAAGDVLGLECTGLGRRDSPLDIWIRDWGFLEGCFFRYQPSYARNLYSPAAIARARRNLCRKLKVRCRPIPLTLDGGNLVHNGRVALLTEKVLRDNPHLSRREVECAILSLGLERVAFLPTEPEDEIGHADGMVRFLSERVLLINQYDTAIFRNYGRRLMRALEKARLDAELVPFPWHPEERRDDGVWSAAGVYINFILTARGIILPVFDHSPDGAAAEILRARTSQPVLTVPATPLARLGGVLNCVSLTF